MKPLQTTLPGVTLVSPDPDRDAPFALGWFNTPYGQETLILMGNPESAITKPTLQNEKHTIRTFLQLEQENKQLTWMIRSDNKTIGAKALARQ